MLFHGYTIRKLWSQEMRFTCDLSLPSIWTPKFGVTRLWEQDDEKEGKEQEQRRGSTPNILKSQVASADASNDGVQNCAKRNSVRDLVSVGA